MVVMLYYDNDMLEAIKIEAKTKEEFNERISYEMSRRQGVEMASYDLKAYESLK